METDSLETKNKVLDKFALIKYKKYSDQFVASHNKYSKTMFMIMH